MANEATVSDLSRLIREAMELAEASGFEMGAIHLCHALDALSAAEPI